ncbi:MAG: type II toxin-antitoxin system RelE/ParE family toxin [Sphingomonadales bacterium]
MKLGWTKQAQNDLDAIFEHILADNPSAALKVAARIEEMAESLLEFPYRGRPGQTPESRELVIPRLPYIVFYSILDDSIVITHVVHGARDRQHD